MVQLLDEIAERFYGVQRKNPMQGMFGDIFKVIFHSFASNTFFILIVSCLLYSFSLIGRFYENLFIFVKKLSFDKLFAIRAFFHFGIRQKVMFYGITEIRKLHKQSSLSFLFCTLHLNHVKYLYSC